MQAPVGPFLPYSSFSNVLRLPHTGESAVLVYGPLPECRLAEILRAPCPTRPKALLASASHKRLGRVQVT